MSCLSCSASCLSCFAAAANCTACDSALGRTLSNGQCICDQFSQDVGVAQCQFVGCTQGFSFTGAACVPICGDGLVLGAEQCDDANTADGDGCSSGCVVEANYSCEPSPVASLCSYNQPLSITLLSTQKLLTSNTLRFTLSIGPAIPALNSLNFSSVFAINISDANLSFSYDGHGTLVAEVTYGATIQGQNATLTFTPTASNTMFWATPPSETEFGIDPANNVPAVYYSDAVYEQVKASDAIAKAVGYTAAVGFVAGLALGKFIGVEMIGVVQVAFIGLMVVDYLQPVLAPLSQIGFVNGINTMFEANKTQVSGGLPNRITALQYEPAMAYTLNYTLILVLLPLVVALVLRLAAALVKSKSQKLKDYSMTALCEYGFTATMFVMYHMAIGLSLQLMYFKASGVLFPINIAACALTVSIVILMIVLYKVKP
jgi:cysteine-rich repeat protein